MDFEEELLLDFNLLCEAIRQPDINSDIKVDLSKIENIINNEIPDVLGDNAPEDFYDLYTDFKFEYERFRDFILYDKLIGKNVIALGGGFSTGKSSFLNTLMGRAGKVPILPESPSPSTSVPTYIISGKDHEVTGINVFDAKISIRPRDLRIIAHGFGEVYNEVDEKITSAVTLGHVVESIFFSTPLHKYENIAFLDTPGYSKPDSDKYSVKTDEQIARGQLNSSNYMLWFIQADAGTITEEDIKFIKTLREDIPKIIVVNKAEKKELQELSRIIETIRRNLDVKGIRYQDVCAFTSRLEEDADDEKIRYFEDEAKRLNRHIEEWNTASYQSNFARSFKQIFVRCKEFYEEQIDEESRDLTRLNTSITKLIAEDIDDEILEPLRRMVKDAQNSVNELKRISIRLKEIQDEFFTEIKFISDIVGISMPEPNEIDLIQDESFNPLQIIEEYKKEKGIKTDSNVADILKDTFENLEPVINKNIGGSEYKNELLGIVTEVCDVDPLDIHINDVYKGSNEYISLIKKNRALSEDV